MRFFAVWLVFAAAAVQAAEFPKDLLPVKFKSAPQHAPVNLVEKGQAKASIAIMGPRSTELNAVLATLQECLEQATGAKLTVTTGKITPPAIVIGDCPQAREAGLDPTQMPVDGFAIKTAADHVFITGRDGAIAGPAHSNGTAWGVCEFLERFVGVRWYYPLEHGRSVPKLADWKVEPVWLEDAPVFRMRLIWPPMSNPWNGSGTQLGPLHTFQRAGNSWPNQIVVHAPNWAPVKEYVEQRPEVFQLRSDKTRDTFMLCYGNPRTLATYLENIENFVAKKPYHLGISGKAITVSPNDAEIACYCEHCRKLWNPDGGQYGSASKIVAKFVADLATEVKKRWPDLTIVYLPYLNYTTAPDGVTFPDNVEVQICGMPGLAQYKEAAIAASEQENIDKWVKLTGHKIQNWHYSCWPENRTSVVYQYPHAAREFYRRNRDKTIGTFINGETDHWPRQHVSLYCWMKSLWNPDFDVDAMMDEYCRRLYGPAAATVREVVALQTTGWESSNWPGGRMSPKGIHEASFPPDRVAAMQALLTKAREQAAGDELTLKRLDYFAAPFAKFFKESHDYHAKSGINPLIIQKVGEMPVIDGKLDDAVWKRAESVAFVRGWDEKQKQPTYATNVKGVWSTDGVAFGFQMSEPTPELLERKIKGRDDSMAWWDDNIELLFDVTGKNEGEFYHFILNPNAAIFDAKGSDASWNLDNFKTAAHVGKDSWTLEVYFPFAAFKEAVRPGAGNAANPQWSGNFTRHRVADRGLQQTLKPRMGSEREYQRMNTTYAKPSNNLTDFAPLRFVE